MGSSSAFATGEIDGLGDLDGGDFYSIGFGISADATTLVGRSTSSNGDEAFRWTSDDGMVGLGDLAGGSFDSGAYGVSSDGSVIVGYGNSANGTEAFRWTQAGGMVGLGDLAGGSFSSTAYAVNSGGDTVVGSSESANGTEAFIWTQAGGMVGLGDLAGGPFSSRAFGVSDDGTIVVGDARVAEGGLTSTSEAFRWTQAGGMVGLGDLDGGSYFSRANAISGDGTVIVGTATSASGREAFRWTQADGMAGLGDLEGGAYFSIARGVNTDGTVIVGGGTRASTREGFIWTADTGMQSLSEWLLGSGLTLKDWSFTDLNGVSDDGKTVVGYGVSASGEQAFIAKEKSGLIGEKDAINSVAGLTNTPSLGILTASMILNGSHGHPISRRALDQKRTMWLAGDYLVDSRYGTDDTVRIAEAGISYRQNDRLTYSLSLGQTWGKSTFQYQSNLKAKGYFSAIEVDVRPFDQWPFYVTATALRNHSHLDIKRGYLNAGNLDASVSTTDQQSTSIKARAQYVSDFVSPFIDYEYLNVRTKGFQESEGGFPAKFDTIKDRIRTLRIGIDKNFTVTDRLTLITTVESAHSLTDQLANLQGSIIDTFRFDLEGRKIEPQWFKGTIGLDYTAETYQASLTLNATTEGDDPQYWAGLNITRAF